jgi:hypothetical protein
MPTTSEQFLVVPTDASLGGVKTFSFYRFGTWALVDTIAVAAESISGTALPIVDFCFTGDGRYLVVVFAERLLGVKYVAYDVATKAKVGDHATAAYIFDKSPDCAKGAGSKFLSSWYDAAGGTYYLGQFSVSGAGIAVYGDVVDVGTNDRRGRISVSDSGSTVVFYDTWNGIKPYRIDGTTITLITTLTPACYGEGSFSGDGSLFLSSGQGSYGSYYVRIYEGDAFTEVLPQFVFPAGYSIYGSFISGDGSRVVFADSPWNLRVYDYASRSLLGSIDAETFFQFPVADLSRIAQFFAPDNVTFIYGDRAINTTTMAVSVLGKGALYSQNVLRNISPPYVDGSITLTETLDPPVSVSVGSEGVVSVNNGTESGYVSPEDVRSHSTFVANANTKAHAIYLNANLYALGDFNGKRVAQLSDGLYELGGTDDDGTQIDAAIYWAPSDLGSGYQKIVDMVAFCLSHGTAGSAVLICDDHEKRVRSLPPVDSQLDSRKARFSLGLSGWTWQAGYENGGADFELVDGAIVPIILSRSVKAAP